MLVGQIVSRNGVANIDCYPTFPSGSVPAAAEGGKLLNVQWFTPVSNNGLKITSFKTTPAKDDETSVPSSLPADSFKAITVQDAQGVGYTTIAVPNSFIASSYASASSISAVTIPTPVIEANFPIPATQQCVADGVLQVLAIPAFTGDNDTYTATGKLNGSALSPTTVSGTSVGLLATAMGTSWGSATGGGTFVANGQNILAKTPAGKFTVTIAQSKAE